MNKKVSVVFMLMAILFSVCLIASNLFATKVFAIGSITLPGAVIISLFLTSSTTALQKSGAIVRPDS